MSSLRNKYLLLFIYGLGWRFGPLMPCLSYPSRHYRNTEGHFNDQDEPNASNQHALFLRSTMKLSNDQLILEKL